MKKFLYVQGGFTIFTLGLYFVLLGLTSKPFFSAIVPFWILVFIFGSDLGVIFFIAGVVGLAVTQLVSETIGLFCALAVFTTIVSFIFGHMEGRPSPVWLAFALAAVQCALLLCVLFWSIPAN
ncbi:MAG: hypothetical protein AAB445_00415 [Patescibacteria group bacterium]